MQEPRAKSQDARPKTQDLIPEILKKSTNSTSVSPYGGDVRRTEGG